MSVVRGHLHGGPHNGLIIDMDHAMTRHRLISWDGNTPSEDVYELASKWDGTSGIVHYEYRRPKSEHRNPGAGVSGIWAHYQPPADDEERAA